MISKKKAFKTIICGNGAFKLEFYIDGKNPKGNCLHITTPSGVFEQKVRNYPFGYLLAAANQGKTSELEAYCVLLYRVSEEIYQDLGFCQDIIKAIQKRDKRLMKRAEKEASNISEAQLEADTALMNDIISEQGLSKKELVEKRKADREMLKEILNEKGEGE